jgi:hypothetical protein
VEGRYIFAGPLLQLAIPSSLQDLPDGAPGPLAPVKEGRRGDRPRVFLRAAGCGRAGRTTGSGTRSSAPG